MAAGFKKATVNASKVASTQTNFPAYVDLSRLGITTLAEAQSVRVYADSGKTTEWAREIVSATEMHVKVPSLTSTTDMYVEWDGVSADYAVTDTYGRNAVWSGYQAVYHLDSLTLDSTGNGYTLTNNNSVATSSSGQLGGCADFGATNTNKSLSVASDVGIAGGNISMTVWYAPNSATATVGGALTHRSTTTDTQDSIWYHGGVPASYHSRSRAGTSDAFSNNAGSISAGTFTHHAYTYDGSTLRGYRSATAATPASYTGNGATNISDDTRIGWDQRFGVYFTGKVDEARITSSILSANWITTEYNNQSDEATFWGTWSTVSSSNTTAFFAML